MVRSTAWLSKKKLQVFLLRILLLIQHNTTTKHHHHHPRRHGSLEGSLGSLQGSFLMSVQAAPASFGPSITAMTSRLGLLMGKRSNTQRPLRVFGPQQHSHHHGWWRTTRQRLPFSSPLSSIPDVHKSLLSEIPSRAYSNYGEIRTTAAADAAAATTLWQATATSSGSSKSVLRCCLSNGRALVSTAKCFSTSLWPVPSSSARVNSAVPRGGAALAKNAIGESKKIMTARQMEALNLLSGGLAGTVASTITNPLDVIKTQLQSSNQIARTAGEGVATSRVVAVAREIIRIDGMKGFFRGLPATLAGIVPARSVYFYAYQRSKTALDPYVPQGSPPNTLLAGFFAGIAGNTITNPIWMVRTRMQLLADSSVGQVSYVNYWDAIRTIFREEGLAGFYKGVAASYWGCSEGAAQFLMYEQLKKRSLVRLNRMRQKQGLSPTDHLPEWSLFLSAAASKMVASIATYPHEVARTRLREQAKMGSFRYSGMWQTLAIIAREEGRQSLYAGMGVHLLKVVPNSALMFLTYELVRKKLGEFDVVN